MRKVHELKLCIEYCDSVYCGEKNFEVRNNDRGYQKGDFIKFTPVESPFTSISVPHEIKNKLYEITYVHSGLGLKNGYVVLGIKEINPYEVDV